MAKLRARKELLMETISALLSIIFFIALAGCSGNDGLLPADTNTTPAKSPAAWEKDPRYHQSVGRVEIACGDVTFTPVDDFHSSYEYTDDGWVCGDGMTFLLDKNKIKSLDQTLTVIGYTPEVSVKLVGGIGHLEYFVILDKENNLISDSLTPKDGAILQLPNDDRICYICVVVSWVASSPPARNELSRIKWSISLR